jgi:hypothetical protein
LCLPNSAPCLGTVLNPCILWCFVDAGCRGRVAGAVRDGLSRRWHDGSCMLLCLVPRLALVAVIEHVCGLCFCVDYGPYVAHLAWGNLPLYCSMVASMVWTMWCLFGLDCVSAYA